MLRNANGLFHTRFKYPEYGKETNIQDPFGTFFNKYLCNLRQVLKVDLFLKNIGEQLQQLPPSKSNPGYDKIQSLGIY